jgi:hypothetical protein
VKANGFALAVGVSREVDFFHFARGCLEFGDEFLFAFDNFVVRFEAVFDIHREIVFGQILNMTEGSFDDKLLAQVFVDGLRL